MKIQQATPVLAGVARAMPGSTKRPFRVGDPGVLFQWRALFSGDDSRRKSGVPILAVGLPLPLNGSGESSSSGNCDSSSPTGQDHSLQRVVIVGGSFH